jgi:hypothetical protein
MIHQNLSDTNQHVLIDPRLDTLKATWSLPAGCTPHGIGLDPSTNHLLISCQKQMTLVIDGNSGSVLMQTDKTGGMLYTTMAAGPGAIQLAGFPLPG